MDGFITIVIEDLLEQLNASQAERDAAHRARDTVVGAIRQAQTSLQASIEQLSSLFRGETIDKAALASLRADKEGQVRAVTTACEQALTELHAAFTPEHRLKLVELVRARRAASPTHSNPDPGF
jgi:hypothetical protein